MFTTALMTIALLSSGQAPARAQNDPAPGQLAMIGKDGRVGSLCPLERTSVVADVSGFGARVNVTQTFKNPSREVIEAIYTFPLPNDAAVDRMQMQIGSRMVEGEIMRREDARMVYEAAKNAGQNAALLDQERPNIFTQSVANITPGATIKITISYVQILKFEEGEFEFTFPMVVGPRYLGNAPDPEKISPPITPEGKRTGTNIDLTVNLDAGAPIQEYKSILHGVRATRAGDNRMRISLAKADEIPNKDFILRYRTTTDTVQDGFIAHMGDKGGFFSLFLMPPQRPTEVQITPREIIFVMDQSGSQSGFPIEKSKELTLKLIKSLRSADTFNVMGFNTSVRALWAEPRLNTPENVAEATKFIAGMQANGGTHIREGVIAALDGQNDPDRLRLVVFNTDGYVGDEAAILDTVQKQRDHARMFTFGIGNSVNRYLVEEMSIAGKGDVEIVTLAEAADGAVGRFVARSSSPVLTDVQVTFEGVQIESALPQAIPDVFSEKPVVITGRYATPGTGRVTLSGKLGGRPWSKTIDVTFPAHTNAPALESIWARRKVDELTRHNFLAAYLPEADRASVDQIIDVALEFGIMTQYTSFVAVEKRIVNVGGKQRTVSVPIEMADGVSYEGIYDKAKGMPSAPMVMSTGGAIGGGGAAESLTRTRALALEGYGAVANDPTVNSIIVRGTSDANLSPAEKRTFRYETRVEKQLRDAKGRVDIQIWLNKVDKAVSEKLTKLGLKVDFRDDGLKIVMGSCNAKDLVELAQMDEVDKIRKLKG